MVDGFGVYVGFIDMEQAEQSSKHSATGLMRALINIYHTKERLAACSATSSIHTRIRTAIFSEFIELVIKIVQNLTIIIIFKLIEYCENKYGCTADKMKRDLTSKRGEERRRLLKGKST